MSVKVNRVRESYAALARQRSAFLLSPKVAQTALPGQMTELSFAVAIAFSLDEASKSIEPVEAWAYMDSDSAPGDLEAELAEDVQHNAIEPATDMIGAAPALDPTMYEQALARFAEEQAEEDFDPDMPVQYNLDYT